MMQSQIRLATENDREALEALWAYCFSDSDDFRSWYFKKYFRPEECLLAVVGTKVAASLQVIDLPTRVGNEIVKAGYIVGVDCLPEYRGHGLTRKLMEEAIQEYAPAHELALLHLMPFEADFYESFGFVYGDYHFDINMDIAEFYNACDRKTAHCFSWQDVELQNIDAQLGFLEQVYERATARYDACVLRRGRRRWQAFARDLAMEGGYLKLLINGADEAVGLLAYILKEDHLFVREALVANSDARKALYYFIASHRSQVKHVEWSAAEDEAVVYRRHKDKSGVQYRPFMMEYIVDPKIIADFASKLPEKDLCFTVDGLGTYMWKAGTRHIEFVSKEVPNALNLTREMLTGIVFDRAGWPAENDESDRLCKLFTKKTIFFNNEYF